MMVKSMVAALRSVTATGMLLFGIMYVFAIIMTQWVRGSFAAGSCLPDVFEEDAEVCLVDEYFGSIFLSFLSLSQIVIFDDTFMLIRPICDQSWVHCMALFIYVWIASFTVLNMLIGIICDIVSQTQ